MCACVLSTCEDPTLCNHNLGVLGYAGVEYLQGFGRCLNQVVCEDLTLCKKNLDL